MTQAVQSKRVALIAAGGTGGHIFPGLALAQALLAQGWCVVWVGGKGTPQAPSMESRLVRAHTTPSGQSIEFEAIDFGGVRGKSVLTQLLLPFVLVRALLQSWRVFGRTRPDVVVGMGGYISFPAAVVAWLRRVPLVLHEQNSVAGLANRVLSGLATRVLTTFPQVLACPSGRPNFIGNPLREAFTRQPPPEVRFAKRSGVLHLLVIGGSLGARGLNDLVPKALALIPLAQRPIVWHQSGVAQLDALQANYLTANVAANCTAFIEDTASAFAQADVIIARSGASTVSELAAVGAAALFVPFPFAVDDHQTTNAKYLVDAGAAWLEQQADLSPQMLADFLQTLTREELLAKAKAARALGRVDATEKLLTTCEELLA